MPKNTHLFVGRKQELDQLSNLLANSSADGQAVVVVGKYGMGKTWLLDQMIQKAHENKALKCFSVRYAMGPNESPGMILRVILDDMFQAARYEAGALNADGKRFEQWLNIYQELGIFCHRTEADFRLLEQLRFDSRKNIFDQFSTRLQLLSHLIPNHSRLLLAVDPELDTLAARVELWTQVVKNLPSKIFFLFAQRYKDSLAINEEFRTQKNVYFIPSLEQQPQGLGDLQDDETEQLLDAYLPTIKDKTVDRQAIKQRFLQYRNHPYAVHAALNLLLLPGFTNPEQLPAEPMPAAVCPLQWKGITEHPLHKDAVQLFKAYAVLEVPALDETACWVADISPQTLETILADPFLGSMIRGESDGRLLYHHHLMAYIRSLLYAKDGTLTPEAEQLHKRAMTGYADLTRRTIKPDPLAVVRLAEHSLAVGGPVLFAETLCQCSESFLTLGFYQTYAGLIDRALVLIAPLSPTTVQLHFQLGQLRRRQGDSQAAIKHYEAALQTARKISDPKQIALVLFGLGRVSFECGHLIEADMWLQDALDYYEVGTDKSGLAEVLVLSAEVQWIQGHTQEAERLLQTALHTVGDIRNHRQQAKIMSAIYAAWGRMYDQLGNIERSAEQYHKALDLTKDIYDQEAEADLRASLGSIFERIGNLKSAEEHISKAMAIHHDLKLLEHWAEDNLRLARIAEMRGKPELKQFHREQARRIYLQLGNKQKLIEIDSKSKIIVVAKQEQK
jgi:tetratricopeptide (TPR) repeat protein